MTLPKNNWINGGVKYNELLLGKPEYDVIIDDKSYNYSKDWYKNIEHIINSWSFLWNKLKFIFKKVNIPLINNIENGNKVITIFAYKQNEFLKFLSNISFLKLLHGKKNNNKNEPNWFTR